ncbi:MAG: nucleotide exchange factor GrpE [Chitinispirillaceae bacterium]
MAKKDTKKDTKENNSSKKETPQEQTESLQNQQPSAEQKEAEGIQGEAEEKILEQIEEEEQSLDKIRQELDAQKERYIRLMAEFDNYKRRTAREFEKLVESANEKLMVELIDVRENFDRAMTAGEQNSDFTRFFDGIKLIFNKFNDVLEKNGLTAFTEVGDQFDPEIHDAMMKMPHAEIPENHIAQIYEKGYRLKNHVVKHAKVIVSSGQQSDAQETESAEE